MIPNALILIVIIKQKKYSTLPFRLLLVSTALWVILYLALILNHLTKYTLQAPNGVCTTVLLTINALLQGANFIETEVVLSTFYIFYRCYKLYSVLSEEATRKLFCRSITVTVIVIFIFTASRFLIIVLLEASYVTSAGYCLAVPDMYRVTPYTQYISIIYTSTVTAQIMFTVCSAILLHTLSKNNNSTQANSSQKCLLKLAIILSSVSLTSGVVYTLAVYLFGKYSVLFGSCVAICERFTILCMLLNKDDVKKFCKCI